MHQPDDMPISQMGKLGFTQLDEFLNVNNSWWTYKIWNMIVVDFPLLKDFVLSQPYLAEHDSSYGWSLRCRIQQQPSCYWGTWVHACEYRLMIAFSTSEILERLLWLSRIAGLDLRSYGTIGMGRKLWILERAFLFAGTRTPPILIIICMWVPQWFRVPVSCYRHGWNGEIWQVEVAQGMKFWNHRTKPGTGRSPEYMPKPGLL
jgi:hypothetical protein